MKKIKFIALLLISFTAIAATINTTIVLRSKTPQGVKFTSENSGKDTLVGLDPNKDTGYVWSYTPDNNKDETWDVYVTQLTGSITATSMILQGCNDTSSGFMSADWHAITGVVTYCADFTGASSTTVPGTAKHYFWYVPKGATTFTYKRVQGIHTGTFTAKYTGKLTYPK